MTKNEIVNYSSSKIIGLDEETLFALNLFSKNDYDKESRLAKVDQSFLSKELLSSCNWDIALKGILKNYFEICKEAEFPYICYLHEEEIWYKVKEYGLISNNLSDDEIEDFKKLPIFPRYSLFSLLGIRNIHFDQIFNFNKNSSYFKECEFYEIIKQLLFEMYSNLIRNKQEYLPYNENLFAILFSIFNNDQKAFKSLTKYVKEENTEINSIILYCIINYNIDFISIVFSIYKNKNDTFYSLILNLKSISDYYFFKPDINIMLRKFLDYYEKNFDSYKYPVLIYYAKYYPSIILLGDNSIENLDNSFFKLISKEIISSKNPFLHKEFLVSYKEKIIYLQMADEIIKQDLIDYLPLLSEIFYRTNDFIGYLKEGLDSRDEENIKKKLSIWIVEKLKNDKDESIFRKFLSLRNQMGDKNWCEFVKCCKVESLHNKDDIGNEYDEKSQLLVGFSLFNAKTENKRFSDLNFWKEAFYIENLVASVNQTIYEETQIDLNHYVDYKNMDERNPEKELLHVIFELLINKSWEEILKDLYLKYTGDTYRYIIYLPLIMPYDIFFEKVHNIFLEEHTNSKNEDNISRFIHILKSSIFIKYKIEIEIFNKKEVDIFFDNNTSIKDYFYKVFDEVFDIYLENNYKCYVIQYNLFDLSQIMDIKKEKEDILIKKADSNLVELRSFLRNRKNLSIKDYRLNMQLMRISVWFIIKKMGVWKALKPLLLAFRLLDLQVLRNDLSFIYEQLFMGNNENIPEEIKECEKIPQEILNTLQDIKTLTNNEEERITLRRELAKYLADCLKPRKKNDPRKNEDLPIPPENFPKEYISYWDTSLNEPNPIWRLGYINAISELGVNPLVNPEKKTNLSGILNKVAESEKLQELKDAALNCANKLKKLRTGVDSGSSKRFLIHAFWELKKAHYLNTKPQDEIFDESKAISIRSHEVRE